MITLDNLMIGGQSISPDGIGGFTAPYDVLLQEDLSVIPAGTCIGIEYLSSKERNPKCG
jgi:hypothetical protein